MLGLAMLEARARIGEDLIPSAFLSDPTMLVAALNTPKVGPIEFEEDSETL